MLERNAISGNTIGVFFESGHGNRLDRQSDRSQSHRHSRLRQLRRQRVRRQPLRRQPPHRRDDRRQPDEPLGDRRPRQLLGRCGRRSISTANGIGDVPHRELDLFGALRRDLPAIGLLGGSPAERLLRFVHARVALPGLAGVVDPAPLDERIHSHDHPYRVDQVVRRPPRPRRPRSRSPARARSRCSSAPTAAARRRRCVSCAGCRRPTPGAS